MGATTTATIRECTQSQARLGMWAGELTNNPLFQGFTGAQLAALAPLFTRIGLVAGACLFEQGDPARRLYVLEAGAVALQHQAVDGGEVIIAVLQPNDVFGWSAALGHSRYTSSAWCRQDGYALSALGGHVRALVRADPVLGRKLLGRLAVSLAARGDGRSTQLARTIQREMLRTRLARAGRPEVTNVT